MPFETSTDHRPSFRALEVEEIRRRAQRGLGLLGPERCEVCSRFCRIDRVRDQTGLCGIGRRAIVASYFPHFGEEDCLRGWNGSGTIFFSGCNLRCVFCVLPDTPVATDEGPRRIDELFERGSDEQTVDGGRIRRLSGVRVRTVTGQLAPAVTVFRHPHRGEVLRVKPASAPELALTPGHEVYACRRGEAGPATKVPAGELSEEHMLVVPKIATSSEPGLLVCHERREERDHVGDVS